LLLRQYFTTAPYACEPASLPKYAPNKEMDAKFREESRRYAAIAHLLARFLLGALHWHRVHLSCAAILK
jgi:hypothetical protein